MTRSPRTILALLVACALLAGTFAASAGAVLPPRNCGTIMAKGKKWQVKADQFRCKKAKRYAKRYIRHRVVPRHFKCRRGARGSALYAMCSATRYDPDRVLHIIKKR